MLQLHLIFKSNEITLVLHSLIAAECDTKSNDKTAEIE